MWGAASVVAAGVGAGAYARWIEPTWIEVTTTDLPVPGLRPAWDGTRLTLLSDFHHGPRVPLPYLESAVAKAAAVGADLVALAGDFVTGHNPEHGAAVAGLFDKLTAPLGVYACPGNHDYGAARPAPGAAALKFVETLGDHGVRMLRNEAVRLEKDGAPLWIGGVDDLWAGRMDADAAAADIPDDEAAVCLCHNPDGADAVAAAGFAGILSGHTHGGQVQAPFLGPPLVPVRNKSRYEGLHRVGGASLYVTRGVGWLYRVRFLARPEVAVLTFRSAGPEGTPM